MTPSRPISASLGRSSRGKWEASSHSITWGPISPSANSRTDLRSCCCSGVKVKSTESSALEISISTRSLTYIPYFAAARSESVSRVYRKNRLQKSTALPVPHLAGGEPAAQPRMAGTRSDASGHSALFLEDHGFEFLKGAIHSGAVYVPVGDHPDRIERRVLRPDAALVESIAEFHGVHARGTAVENDNVRFHAGGINLQAGNFGDALRKMLRVLMVLMQT